MNGTVQGSSWLQGDIFATYTCFVLRQTSTTRIEKIIQFANFKATIFDHLGYAYSV